MWQAWKLYNENRIMDLKDATLFVSDDDAIVIQEVLKIALMYVQSAPEKCPSMFLVAEMLVGNVNVDTSSIDENNSWPDNFVYR